MEQKRWGRIKRIVADALDLPPEDRAAFLDEACGEDSDLRREVEALLAVSTSEADVYEDVRIEPSSLRQLRLDVGDELGPYQVMRELATGGMSRVYLARDTRNDRDVAIKLLRPRAARLHRAEQRMLARLTHRSIATLYDSGSIGEGHEYLVMEYVDGLPITDYCHEHNLTLQDRLTLFSRVCGAVQYAHQQLVVHRDLKPSNILVTRDGEPKLLDFGIAKELPTDLAAVTVTAAADRPMTYAFASPEQVGGEPTAIATDVYSLGVLLCLLLTGRLPYRVKSLHDLPWAIRNLEPQSMSTLVLGPVDAPSTLAPILQEAHKLSKSLSGDLDAIVLKTLRKKSDDRYASVEQLAEDIRRHLSSEPVQARRGTKLYRVRKFLGRYKATVLATTTIVLLLTGLTLALARSLKETKTQRDAAEEQARRAQAISDFLTRSFEHNKPSTPNDGSMTVRELLDNAAERIPEEFSDDPFVQSHLMAVIGQTYTSLGIFDKAEELLEHALTLRIAHYGEQHQAVAESLLEIALLYDDLARYEDAEHALNRALHIQKNVLDQSHPSRATTHNNLGALYFRMGKYDEALEQYRASLSIRQALYKPPHARLASALNNLGILLNKTGKYSEAETAHRQALRMRKDLFGEEHDSVAMSLHNLARVLDNQGKPREALQIKRDVLALRRKILPSNHPHLTVSINNLAVALHRIGHFKEAADLHREALALRMESFSTEHPDIAQSMSNLGNVLIDLGSLDEAEELLAQALSIEKDLLGEDHPSTAGTLAQRAKLELARMEYAAAEASIRRALALAEERPASQAHLSYAHSLANILLEKGDTTRAQEALTAAYDLADQLLTSDDTYHGSLRATSARLYLKEGRFQEAAVHAQQALTILHRELPKEHWWILDAQISLTLAHAQLGNCLNASEIRQSILSTDVPYQAHRMRNNLKAADILCPS